MSKLKQQKSSVVEPTFPKRKQIDYASNKDSTSMKDIIEPNRYFGAENTLNSVNY